MDVRAGFDGAGRVGGWVPLDVQLVNEGSELKAQVEVVVDQPGGRSMFSFVPTTFSLPVVLPRLSNRRFSMEVNLPNATNNRLTARLVSASGGELITEQDISMTRVPLGDYFCGVLARDPSTYDFLAALDLPPPIRRARTAPLDPATVPDQAAAAGQLRLPDHRQRGHRAAAARAARSHPGLGRHGRPADRGRRLDLAEHARLAAARPAAGRADRPDRICIR